MLYTPRLSVIIPTMPTRRQFLHRMLHSLGTHPSAEILIIGGPGTMAAKIKHGYEIALGKWSVTLDDDDWVARGYLDTLCATLHDKSNLDYLGYRFLCLINGQFRIITESRGDGSVEWGADTVTRGPCPKCVIRTALARKIPFPDTFDGDHTWMRAAQPLIKRHEFLPAELYIYDYWSNGSAFAGSNIVRDIGEWPCPPYSIAAEV